MIDETVNAFGGLDVLVSNASTNISGTLESLSDEQALERVMGKTLAAMRLSRAALPYLRKSSCGRIICVGGTAARTPANTSLPSGLGNSSLVNFVKHFSNDVGPDGITVNVVHPPFTKTDRYPARLEAHARSLVSVLAEAEADFAANFPIGRIVEPGDIAPMVLSWRHPALPPSLGRPSRSTAVRPRWWCGGLPSYRLRDKRPSLYQDHGPPATQRETGHAIAKPPIR